eukprot:Em0011g36a
MPVNKEKLEKLQQQSEKARIGGKGTARRKRKVVHKTATDDKKLQNSLKKLGVNSIQGIEEVNMMKEDGHVLHFTNPKVQASLTANTFAISGNCEEKPLTDLLPGIFNQLVSGRGAESLSQLRKLAQTYPTQETGGGELPGIEEEVPELVGNFDEPSKTENI